MGERIVVMDRGRIQQVAKPLEVYERPANPFVAGFIGTPPMNLFPAGVLGDGVVGLRPEHMSLGEPRPGALPAVVDFVEPLGSETLVHVRLAAGGHPAVLRLPGFVELKGGVAVNVIPDLTRSVEFK